MRYDSYHSNSVRYLGTNAFPALRAIQFHLAVTAQSKKKGILVWSEVTATALSFASAHREAKAYGLRPRLRVSAKTE